jgi:hypothetical protein
MNISKTTYPTKSISQNDWMKEFRVSSQVNKYDGVDRARAMMAQWEEGKTESVWKTFVNSIKLVTNF